MIYNKYIDSYVWKVERGEIIVGEDIKKLIKNVIHPKLSQDNIVIKHDLIEQQINKINEYFPFKLFDWQEFAIALTHCYYDDDTLVWNQFLLMMGRGAGKNGFIAGLSFYYTTPFHGVREYNIDIVANSERQAKTSFEDVRLVIQENKKLHKYFKCTKEEIIFKKTNSYIHFNTSNAKTKDGLRSGAVIFDEIHEFENYKNIKVFRSGLGKKKYPRTFYITTNGYVRGGVLDEFLELAEAILNGENKTSKLLPIIFRLDHKDEVHDQKMWSKANPSLIYLPHLKAEMEQEYLEMERQPQMAIEFMTKRMNLPAQNCYTPVASWEKIKATNRPIPDLRGYTCIGGIDYSSVQDFTSCGLLFKLDDEYIWFQHTFICYKALEVENREFKFDIPTAEAKGLCTIVREESIQPYHLTRWFLEQAQHYHIKNIYCDDYRKSILKSAFDETGLPLEVTRSGAVTHSKLFPLIEYLFANEKVVFGDDMMMRWYTNNVYVDDDGHKKGNKVFKKIEERLRKTDGFFAFLHAMSKQEELPVTTQMVFYHCHTY